MFRHGHEAGTFDPAELVWLETGSMRFWFLFDCECCLYPDRDYERSYHSDWTDLFKVRCGCI